jgi:hypothetical protein
VKPRLVEIGVVLSVFLVLVCLAGCLFPFQILYYLAVGWAYYLYRIVPEVQVSWSGVATAAVCLALLAVGLHRFLGWLYTGRGESLAEPARQWPARWTAAMLGVVVLMFVSGIAAVGVTHQTAWLATSPEPILDGGMRQPAARIQSSNNLHILALGMHNYSDTNGKLPPHAVYGPGGQPLLSWRVLILPYVEEEELFKEFHLDEPWDSPHNLRLLPRMPRIYAPVMKENRPKEYATFYQAFVGNGAAFEGREGLHLPGGFPDGTSNTILIVEAGTAVPWTKPADLPYSPDSPIPPLGALSPKYFLVAMADSSVRTVYKEQVTEATLRAAITRNGGEILGPDW